MFVNYTERMNYHAAHSADEAQGILIDMTNWATLYLPRSSAPQLNLGALGANPFDQVRHEGADAFRQGYDKGFGRGYESARSTVA